VVLVLAEHGSGMPLVDDQDAVEEFAANAADEAFGDRVGPRCPDRCLDDGDAGGGEDGVEGGGEFGVAVPEEEPEATAGVVKVHPQVAGLLGQPGAGGMGGDPEDVHPAGGVLDDEERVEPVQRDGVQVEQVAGEDRLWLCAEELRPARSCPPRRGVDAGPVQDGPDGGGADPVAEAGELAVDAAVAPLGFSVARASSPRRRGVGSSRVSALIRARSVQLILGRGVRRRSTASWLRRTRISMSLLVSDRARSTIQPRSVENI
jgi:hypothetical protein